MMCGMYTINGVHGPERRSSGGNTSSNWQVSGLIPRPAFHGTERMCQRHVGNQNSHPPVLVRKPLCNQFIHYHISSSEVFYDIQTQVRVTKKTICTHTKHACTPMCAQMYTHPCIFHRVSQGRMEMFITQQSFSNNHCVWKPH